MSTLIPSLLLAHILGDFVLQPGSWVRSKEERRLRSLPLYGHALVHLGLLLVLLSFDPKYLAGIAVIAASHWGIDAMKPWISDRLGKRKAFALDQLAHGAVLAAVAAYYEPLPEVWKSWNSPQVIWFAACFAAVTFGGAVLIGQLLSGWKVAEVAEEDSLPQAGRYIGILERAFVFGFILLNQWQAIGFLIAAKSIFRFSDLSRARDRQLTEYILTGTLLSFGFAVVLALLYRYGLEALRLS